MNLLKRLFVEEEGQGLVEYGLILALVVLVAFVGLNALGVKVDEIFDTITTKLGGIGATPVSGS